MTNKLYPWLKEEKTGEYTTMTNTYSSSGSCCKSPNKAGYSQSLDRDDGIGLDKTGKYMICKVCKKRIFEEVK